MVRRSGKYIKIWIKKTLLENNSKEREESTCYTRRPDCQWGNNLQTQKIMDIQYT